MSLPSGEKNSVHSEFDAWGIYVKPMYPVTEALDIYALLGWGSQNTVNHIYEPGHESLSWGLGTAYSFTDNISVFIDYVSIYDDTAIEDSIDLNGNIVDVDIDSRSLNIGISYNF